MTETSVNDSETEKTVTAGCPAGKEAIGGGVRINSPASVKVAINGSTRRCVQQRSHRLDRQRPRDPEEAGNWSVVAYAVCAEL